MEKRGPDFFWLTVMDTFIQWRSIEQMFLDLLDRPKSYKVDKAAHKLIVKK